MAAPTRHIGRIYLLTPGRPRHRVAEGVPVRARAGRTRLELK